MLLFPYILTVILVIRDNCKAPSKSSKQYDAGGEISWIIVILEEEYGNTAC